MPHRIRGMALRDWLILIAIILTLALLLLLGGLISTLCNPPQLPARPDAQPRSGATPAMIAAQPAPVTKQPTTAQPSTRKQVARPRH